MKIRSTSNILRLHFKYSFLEKVKCFDILPSALGGIRQVNENKHGRSGINWHITAQGTEL